jgi:DNA helicase HerA-like ATPase
MTTFTIEVDNSESKFIKNLLKKFDFVRINEQKPSKLSAENKRILKGIEEAVKEVNLHKEGKIELQDAFDMIAKVEEELKNESYHVN